ncbi:hypothetical protein SprV_0902755400 [Sparganum proliferum]
MTDAAGEPHGEGTQTHTSHVRDLALDADSNFQGVSKRSTRCWWHHESDLGPPFIHHPLICRLLWLHPDLSPGHGLQQAVLDSSGTCDGDIARDGYQRFTESSRRRQVRDFNSTPMEKQLTCVHIVVVTVPILFVFISLTGSQIDGEPLSGLCFVGITSLWAHCALVVFPLGMCLFLKAVYLCRAMLFMSQLRSKFAESFFLVDREMAHRLVMSIRAYVIYLLALLGLLLFFVGVHSYVYVQQPYWLESQRNFFFCQLRHRLMGLDVFAASVACHSPSSVFSVLQFGAVRQQTQQFPPLPPLIHGSAVSVTPTTSSSSPRESLIVGDSQRKPESSARLVTTEVGGVLRRIARDFNPSSVAAAAADDEAPPLLSPFDPFLTGHGGSGGGGANGSGSVFGFSESARPLTGPIFLNLLTYFAVNLIFASMCLLDVSVKRRWGQLFRRIVRAIYPRRSNSSVACDRRKKTMGAAAGAASEAVSFASSTPSCCFNGGGVGNGNQMPSYCTEIALDRLPLSFSWWDPGVFFLFPTRPATTTTTSLSLRNKLVRPPACECGVMLSGTAEAKPRQLQDHQLAASPRDNDTAQPTHTSGSATNSSNSQNAVTLRAAVSDVSCSYGRRYSSSTNEESCIASALSSSGIGSCANQGVARSAVTTAADRDTVAPGTGTGSHGSSKFRGDVIHKSGSVNSAQSLFLRHHPPPLSSLSGGPRIPQTTGQSDPTARPVSAAAALAASLQPLQAVAAAAAGEIDAHLTAAVALHQTLSRSGRRHRHRRILPGKSLCRRRLASNRSLSITGLPITGLSGLDRASLSNLSASLVRSALRLTAASSTQDLPVADGGISEAQRHSIAASLSRVLAPYCLSAAATVANANAPAAAAHLSQSPAGNSRATSVLGEGRLSTSSAPIDQQNQSQTQHFRGSSGSINTWRRLSGFNAPPTATAAGSRMSLRSLSYASSTGSGAQSYNSFQLLAEHAGASWRELWRTRMLLMDVLRWAQAVAATNSDPATGVASSNSYYPVPSNTALMGGQGNSGTDLTASEVPPPPSSVADEAAADWTNQLSAMVMYLLSQVQQQQQPEDPPPPPPTGDPVLMAALVAATAAASAAMQQQQEYNRQRFSDEQPSTTTTAAAVGTGHTAAKSPAGGAGSATTVTAGAVFPISSPHFVSPAGVYPPPQPPPPPLHPFYQMQSPRFPAPICVGATSPPQFCQRGPPDLLADHHRAFAQAAARAEENVCHLDASAATPSLQPPNPPMWGPGSPQTVVISPAGGGGGGWPRPYPPMPTVYAAPPPPVPPSLRHYSPSQQWASAAAASVPRHCYPTVWHQSVEATPPHLAPPSQTVLANVSSSSSMVPFGPPLTAFPAPALIPGQGGASPSAAAAAASLSHWSAHTRRRGRKKALNDEAGIGGSHEDSDAFDSEDDIISDTEEKQTGDGDATAGVDDGDQGALHVPVMQAPSPWPLPGCPDEGDSTGYSEAFEAIGGSTRPETEEDDGDISSVSQSASQVVPNCAKSLGLPPKQQQQPTASASGDPATAAPSATEARKTAKQDR